jgi:hypothetical protein
MKRGVFAYKVGVEVKFTKPEINLMIKLAKSHYDNTCQLAGMTCAESGDKNGFLAQLKLFTGHAHIWQFHEFDLTAKILEPYRLFEAQDAHRREKLFRFMCDSMSAITERYKVLEGLPQ